jgi:hypothetical protein
MAPVLASAGHLGPPLRTVKDGQQRGVGVPFLNRQTSPADYRKGMHGIVPKRPRLAATKIREAALIAAAAFGCAAAIWAFLAFLAFLAFTPIGHQLLNYLDPPPPDCG